MNYVLSLFLSQLPFVTTENRIVNGKEEPCLIIPTKTNGIVKGRRGNYCAKFLMEETPLDAKHSTHKLHILYNKDVAAEAIKGGYLNKIYRVGHAFADVRDINRKKDRTNNMTPIVCTGTIMLDDITPDDIIQDPRTGKRYVRFTFRKADLLDAFGNSHEMVVATEYGEHQIGIAREWPNATKQNARLGALVEKRFGPQEVPNQPNNSNVTPSSIDGYTF